MIERTIRRRTACASNQIWESFCERKHKVCELGSHLCVAIVINDVPRRSHQNVNLFPAPPRRTARVFMIPAD
jgi:hypothetical protein